MDYKKLDKADLFYKGILPDNYPKGVYLRETDSEEFDENYIKGFQSKIKREFIPWVDKFSSFDDFVAYIEEGLRLYSLKSFKDNSRYINELLGKGTYSFLFETYLSKDQIKKAWEMYEIDYALSPQHYKNSLEGKKARVIKFLKSKGYKV